MLDQMQIVRFCGDFLSRVDPLDPMDYAGSCWIISRMQIVRFCGDFLSLSESYNLSLKVTSVTLLDPIGSNESVFF